MKQEYALWVTHAEHEAMERNRSGPDHGATVQDNGTDQRHTTCKAAKTAGLGPYSQGTDPECDWYRDADKDGIVCE